MHVSLQYKYVCTIPPVFGAWASLNPGRQAGRQAGRYSTQHPYYEPYLVQYSYLLFLVIMCNYYYLNKSPLIYIQWYGIAVFIIHIHVPYYKLAEEFNGAIAC
jgi:hypothetical protein